MSCPNKDYAAIPKAYVFHDGNINSNGKTIYYLTYFLMLVVKQTDPGNPVYMVDFSGLT